MKLEEQSIRWALKHLFLYGDTDLFPKLIEIDCLYNIAEKTIDQLKNIDLGNYQYGAMRRFIVPKEELSYRLATQLDPLDNIILTAIIHQYGDLIEKRRIPISTDSSNKIFSYRFDPQQDYSLYNPNISWLEFWNQCKKKISRYKYAVHLDIADFYNQIYHHNIENQLLECGFPNQVKKWIENLLKQTTAKVSRGIPVGPHSTHLLAEMSLIPIDNTLSNKGLDYCRYVDDIIVFCDDYTQARVIVYQMAESLDRQQKLVLQQQKTKIYNKEEFETYCESMLQDRPINEFEKEILTVLRNSSNRNPYSCISLSDISIEEMKVFEQNRVEAVLSDYLNEKEPNFARLRWFLRRLSQVGVPSAVEFCIIHMDELTPAISDVCRYLISVNNNDKDDWKVLGTRIFDLLDNNKIIKSNEYFQMTLLSLFGKKPSLNNTEKLIATYRSSSSNLRREILLSAYTLNMGDWLRELKEDYHGLNIWSQRAFIIASRTWPEEERKFFLAFNKNKNIDQGKIENNNNNQNKDNKNILNDLLIKWANSQTRR